MSTITDSFEARGGYHVSPEYKYLESDVAELLAYTRKLEQKRTLDLRELSKDGEEPPVLIVARLLGRIRTQLPDIEVLT